MATLTPHQIKAVKGLGCLQDKRYEDVFNGLTLTRNGAQNYVLVFNEKQRCSSEYQLGSMSLELAIATRKLSNTLQENGKLHLEYIVELQGCSNGLRVIDIRLDQPLTGIVREYR